jgi:hypothetical protein
VQIPPHHQQFDLKLPEPNLDQLRASEAARAPLENESLTGGVKS